MARGFAQIPLLFACCGFAPLVAHAQYEVDEQNSVWLRALIDVRVARGPEFPSWTDSGPGKLRFGGRSTDSGFEHVTRVELANLAVQFGASLPWGIRAQAQLNVQPDLADSYHPWLVEAFLRKEWGDQQSGWGLQTGLAGSPFSLEHTGPAWTPEYTISASALDNWLWEEISVAGVEGEWWHVGTRGPRLGIVVGGGFGPDQLGRLLALRGWVIADGLSGYNADLPLPNGTRTDIFDERDDRPAAYALVTISDPRERGSIKVGYFDNRGDQNADGSWNTHFTTIGAVLHPLSNFDVVVQYLDGTALVRDTTNDSSIRAFYALISFRHRSQRATVRYDEFHLGDLDGGNSTAERGDGITAAYSVEFGLRHRIAAEYTWLDSTRPGSTPSERSHDGWQLSYRFRY
ncbi:MAG TPA: hypothetical protein VL494_25310 [Steroidobacteraceae bacterium]|jgi:hypothetical protein|nr:hypothetical protein [Steroidobacteraceae bacterium]